MTDFLSLFGIHVASSSGPSLADSLFDVSNTTMILVLALSLLGTVFVGGVSNRNTMIEQATTYSCLFIGGLIANQMISRFEMPLDSEFAQAVVSTNIGMLGSSLLILYFYGTEGYLNK